MFFINSKRISHVEYFEKTGELFVYFKSGPMKIHIITKELFEEFLHSPDPEQFYKFRISI